MRFVWMAIISIAIMQFSVFCTTIYLHRAKTHRGVELHPLVGLLMHLELSLFTGIVPRQWVAVHRKHHHFSDEQGDPHSPYLEGLWKVLFGNFFMYRKECNNVTTVRKYTPNWDNDLIDRIPGQNWLILAGLGLFVLMFGWVWGPIAFFSQAVGYIFLNSSINSICHMVGYRNYDNKATNLQSIALVTGGEGLHNNHHEYPTSARFSLRGREIDPGWYIIRMLESFGLAKVNPVPIAKAA